MQNAGDAGIAGATVSLFNCTDTLIATTTTDANGFYLFSDLPAGDYYVVFSAPSGHLPSPMNVGADDKDSDADMGSELTKPTLR